MQKNLLTPHEDIYTEDFENRVKEPIEYLQFLSWIKELIRITEAINASHDFMSIDLFYIRIYGLFDVFNKKKTNSVSVCKDAYTLYVKKCIEEMFQIMTNDEYITLVYYRHCAAHVFQSFYDLFDAKGQRKDVKQSIMIRGKEMQLSVEDIDRTLHRLFCSYYNNDTSFEKEILQKLTPFVEKLQEGWKDRAITHLTQMGFSKDSEQYKDLIAS
jgi:hypothetical protein